MTVRDDGIRLDRPLIPGMRSPLSPSQLWRILWARRWWIAATTALFILFAVAVALLVPKEYVGSAALVVDIPTEDPSGQDNVPSMLADNYLATQIDLLKSQRVLLRVVEQRGLTEDRKARATFAASAPAGASFKRWVAEELGKHLIIASGTTSRLLQVQFDDPSPQRAAAIANAVVRAYRHVRQQMTSDPARERLQNYTAYLDDLRSRVDTAQNKLSSAQQRAGIINLNRSSDAATQRLEDLGVKLNQAESDRQTAQAKVKRIQQLKRQGKPVTAQADILASNFVQQLKGRLVELQSRRAELAKTLGSSHPRMQSLNAQIATVRARLNQEIDDYLKANRGQEETAADRESALRAALARERSGVLVQQKKRDEVASLVRALDSSQQIYQAALGQYDQVLSGTRSRSYNIAIVSWASPPRWPTGMSNKIKLLFGLILGVLVGGALALLVELADRRVRDDEDMVRELGLPVFGQLPH